MALEGTLKDFSLADIFQLIGLQKKTGVLTLTNVKEEARILFMNGMVVGADTNSQKLENHLGHVLVQSNRISQEELEEVLVIQSHTLQRLGQVLIQKGFIKPEDLRDSLQIQTTQIIYRLFRWQDGEYHFQQEKFVDYDQENFSPITSESILMEGVRMLDEWPMIEQIIPSFDVLLEKTPKGASVRIVQDRDFSLEASAGESFDALLDNVLSDEDPEEVQPEMQDKLEREQERILQLVEGVTIVQDIIDRSGSNEFETCRVLYDLVNMGYLRRVSSNQEMPVIEEHHHIPIWIPCVLLSLLALLSFAIGWNPINQYFPRPGSIASTPAQFELSSISKLNTIADAIDLHYAREGRLPLSMGALVQNGMLSDEASRDASGARFRYDLDIGSNSVTISGLTHEGKDSESLKIQRSYPFSATNSPGL